MHKRALALRLEGKSWTETARALGVSTSLARYHLRSAKAIYAGAADVKETNPANRESLAQYFPPQPKPNRGTSMRRM